MFLWFRSVLKMTGTHQLAIVFVLKMINHKKVAVEFVNTPARDKYQPNSLTNQKTTHLWPFDFLVVKKILLMYWLNTKIHV